MARSLVALGSNLGDRRATLDRAIGLLEATEGVEQVWASRWHATPPIGGPGGQGEFLNGAALVETSLAPEALHRRLREIELTLGRERHERWAARTLDLDLLLYDDATRDGEELTLPHPRMAFRRFVLAPAAEVAPAMRHPRIGWTIAELLANLDNGPPYVAIAALPCAGGRRLAAALAAHFDGSLLAGPLAANETDLAGPPPRPPVEFVRRQIELLAEAANRVERQEIAIRRRPGAKADAVEGATASPAVPLLVSDFWVELTCRLARRGLADDQRDGVDRAIERLGPPAWRPRLIVALEAPVAQNETELQADERAALRELLAEAGHGPVLALEAAPVEALLPAVAAAVESMG